MYAIRSYYEREALGDAARVDARAVERRAALAAGGLQVRHVPGAGIEPAEGRHHVLPGLEEAGGALTDLDGVPTIEAGHCVTTNGALHDEVLRRIRGD